MAFSKASNFNKYNQYIALICQALSHPARIQILREIVSLHGEPASYKKIASKIPLAQSTISQHVAFLRKMDIIIPKDENEKSYVINYKLSNTLVALIYLVSNAGKKTPDSIVQELKALSRAK